jgi:hypothetical protein
MKNPNDKPEVQFPVQNKTKKTQLEIQIAELQQREQQIAKQLKLWETKLKKANNLLNCFWTANKFGKQFLADLVEKEKTQEQPDNLWLEHLLKNKIEFAFKFSLGTETFTKLVSERVEREIGILQIELENIQTKLRHQERKFARLQARRQGKILLDCEYRKNLGCFGDYQCENCQVNYPVASPSEALKGGNC